MTPYEELMGHDTWRVFRIMSEFVEAFDTLGSLGAAVSIYGAARLPASGRLPRRALARI